MKVYIVYKVDSDPYETGIIAVFRNEQDAIKYIAEWGYIYYYDYGEFEIE